MLVAEQVEYIGQLHGMDASTAASATSRWLERLAVADRATSKVEALSHGNQQRVQRQTGARVRLRELLPTLTK